MRRDRRTAFLKESFTDMYSHGEVHLVSVFCFFLMSTYMWGNGFTEIIQNHTGIDFLKDSIILAAVSVNQTDGVFEFTEACFLAPAHSVKLFNLF